MAKLALKLLAVHWCKCAREAGKGLLVKCKTKQEHHMRDATNSVHEEFLEFIHCDTGTSGNAVADKILEALEEYGLNVNYLCGQAFDGAGNMAGK